MTLAPGLSPRVRGNRPGWAGRPVQSGPIPACAGQPSHHKSAIEFGRAYPRVCGATTRRLVTVLASWGLSPRVRGNRNSQNLSGMIFGPIPACAGQPFQLFSLSIYSRAYPRVCGATAGCTFRAASNRGLSPRVRGNRKKSPLRVGCGGPIPACAGQPQMHRG